jgi:hypothetical protein
MRGFGRSARARGYKDIERAIENLSRRGALTASLNWYRANLARPACPARHAISRR